MNSKCESPVVYSARAAHCGMRVTSKPGNRESRMSRAETTSAKYRPTTSPHTICCAPTRTVHSRAQHLSHATSRTRCADLRGAHHAQPAAAARARADPADPGVDRKPHPTLKPSACQTKTNSLSGVRNFWLASHG